MKPAYLINLAILIAFISLLVILFYKDSCQISPKIDKSNYDSILRPHIIRIARLQHAITITKQDLRSIAKKAKIDSISYKNTISRLIKERDRSIHLKSIDNVPSDSIQLAMDCLKKDPIRDSIDSANYSHIATLEREKVELVKDYESIMDANQEEKNQLDSMISIKDSQITELKKDNKKLKRRSKILSVLIPVALVGGVLLAK